jgi:hypothetical protein
MLYRQFGEDRSEGGQRRPARLIIGHYVKPCPSSQADFVRLSLVTAIFELQASTFVETNA